MASIVKRKNRYSVVYTYKDDDGNQHQKWETFDTNADAKKRKTQIEFEQQSGTFIIPNATTVADLLEEYCSVYGVNNWAMSTYRSKKGLMYNYIIPLIGDVKLDELTPRLMDKFYQSLLKVKTKSVQLTNARFFDRRRFANVEHIASDFCFDVIDAHIEARLIDVFLRIGLRRRRRRQIDTALFFDFSEQFVENETTHATILYSDLSPRRMSK